MFEYLDYRDLAKSLDSNGSSMLKTCMPSLLEFEINPKCKVTIKRDSMGYHILHVNGYRLFDIEGQDLLEYLEEILNNKIVFVEYKHLHNTKIIDYTRKQFLRRKKCIVIKNNVTILNED